MFSIFAQHTILGLIELYTTLVRSNGDSINCLCQPKSSTRSKDISMTPCINQESLAKVGEACINQLQCQYHHLFDSTMIKIKHNFVSLVHFYHCDQFVSLYACTLYHFIIVKWIKDLSSCKIKKGGVVRTRIVDQKPNHKACTYCNCLVRF